MLCRRPSAKAAVHDPVLYAHYVAQLRRRLPERDRRRGEADRVPRRTAEADVWVLRRLPSPSQREHGAHWWNR
eukprot:gene5837-biopygen2383